MRSVHNTEDCGDSNKGLKIQSCGFVTGNGYVANICVVVLLSIPSESIHRARNIEPTDRIHLHNDQWLNYNTSIAVGLHIPHKLRRE